MIDISARSIEPNPPLEGFLGAGILGRVESRSENDRARFQLCGFQITASLHQFNAAVDMQACPHAAVTHRVDEPLFADAIHIMRGDFAVGFSCELGAE